MSQIAQQDHLYIDVTANLDEGETVMSEVGPKLLECAKGGTILDVVLRRVTPEMTMFASIIAADYGDKAIVATWLFEGTIASGVYQSE